VPLTDQLHRRSLRRLRGFRRISRRLAGSGWLRRRGGRDYGRNRLARDQGVQLALQPRLQIAYVADVNGLDLPALADNDHRREAGHIELLADLVARIAGDLELPQVP
jgi:hypothetical protein